jgi:hypothetical protein
MLICGSGPCGGADVGRKLVREIGWGFGSGSLSKMAACHTPMEPRDRDFSVVGMDLVAENEADV